MILKRWLYAFLVFAFVLASCDSDDIVPQQTDWCYIFDFTTNAYTGNMTILNGSWVSGDGLWPNESGLLRANYIHTSIVKPEQIILTIAPVSGTSGVIDVEANAIIFGVPFMLDAPIPADIGERSIDIPVEDPTYLGTTANFTVQVSQPMLIRQLEVRGNGLNPFPFNNCENEASPTPSLIVPDTATPTHTPTPTPSDTPTPNLTITPQTCVLPGEATPTPGPTNTPEGGYDWVEVFDFRDDDGGWEPEIGTTYYGDVELARYVPGSGWEDEDIYFATGSLYRTTNIGFGFPSTTTVNSIKVEYERVPGVMHETFDAGFGIYANNNYGAPLANAGQFSIPASPYEWTGSAVGVNKITLILLAGVRTDHTDPGGSARIWRVTVAGMGDSPFSDVTPTPYPDCTVTPTATASDIPASTTPQPSRTNIPRTPTVTPTPTRTPVVVASPTRTNTPGPTSTALPTISTATPGPTSTLIPSPTYMPTFVPTEDPGGGGGDDPRWTSCGEHIEVVSLQDLGDYLSQYWNCAVVPYFANILDGITGFFSWAVNTGANIFGWLGSVPGWLGGWVSNIGIQISNLWQLLLGILGAALSFIFIIINIIGLIIAVIVNLLTLLVAWAGQFITRAESIVTAWTLTAPQPIPALPRCVSQPMESGVCAVYYLAEHTILSGSIGQLLIPILAIIIDLVLVMYFVKTVRNLIRKSSEVTTT